MTPEVEESGENEREIDMNGADFSPLLELIECMGDEELKEECQEPTRYILEFEKAPVNAFPHYRKLVFNKLKGIELKRNEVRTRKKVPLLDMETWEWDTYPWDPGDRKLIEKRSLSYTWLSFTLKEN